MSYSVEKIQVALVARQFVYRLGLKTIFSVIGIEPDLVEFSSFTELQKKLEYGYHPKFMIVKDDILNGNDDNFRCVIREDCPDCKLMIVVDDKRDNRLINKQYVNLNDQKQVIDIFQDFFADPSPENESNNLINLSERELDVLKQVALGLSNKEIADTLFISANTVITHRKNITDKLGIKTISGLTVYAIINNIISPEEVKN